MLFESPRCLNMNIALVQYCTLVDKNQYRGIDMFWYPSPILCGCLKIARRTHTVKLSGFTYKKTDNTLITPLFSPTFGTINGALTLNRLSNAPTILNKPSGLSIGQTGINFELLLGNSALNSKGKTTTDLDPLLDGLSTTGKNVAYFSYTESGDGSAPIASTLTYDPVKKAGARFYDLNGD